MYGLISIKDIIGISHSFFRKVDAQPNILKLYFYASYSQEEKSFSETKQVLTSKTYNLSFTLEKK